MIQDANWLAKYNEVKNFIETNKRNPSKHRIEEHLMLSFIKHNRKLLNKAEMKDDRVEKFNELLAMMEEYKRFNQWR